jgi:hypothetical protein
LGDAKLQTLNERQAIPAASNSEAALEEQHRGFLAECFERDCEEAHEEEQARLEWEADGVAAVESQMAYASEEDYEETVLL